MPFAVLGSLLLLAILLLLVINIIYPLINPHYRIFWMIRKDRYNNAKKMLQTSCREVAINEINKEILTNIDKLEPKNNI